MKPILFNLYAAIAQLLGCMLGIFGAFGACVPFFGSSVFDTALGSPPDYSHPALWMAFILMFPSLFIGAAGAMALFVMPVAFRFPDWAHVAPYQRGYLDFLRSYAESILRYVASEEQRVSMLKKHDA